jgi:hypothetical protein
MSYFSPFSQCPLPFYWPSFVLICASVGKAPHHQSHRQGINIFGDEARKARIRGLAVVKEEEQETKHASM